MKHATTKNRKSRTPHRYCPAQSMSRNLPLHLAQIVVYNFVKLIHDVANGKQFP